MITLATLRRKNQGKQFTCVDEATRFIFHWYRPGEPLPQLIQHNGHRFMLTKELVEKAQANGRTPPIKIDVRDLPRKVQEAVAEEARLNGKGAYVTVIKSDAWDTVKAWALYAAAAGLSCWAAYEAVKVAL